VHMITKKVLIKGKVQGVWFRASAKQQAEMLGVVGWVRNTEEGAVEGVFQGSKENVDELIQWCHQGPSFAHVTQVLVESDKGNEQFTSFSIRR